MTRFLLLFTVAVSLAGCQTVTSLDPFSRDTATKQSPIPSEQTAGNEDASTVSKTAPLPKSFEAPLAESAAAIPPALESQQPVSPTPAVDPPQVPPSVAASSRPQLPLHAKLNYFGNGWECERGYYVSGSVCAKVELPQNAKLNYFGNAWECEYGFYRSGNACAKVELPQNAKLNYFGNAWECQYGFYRSGNACARVELPQNAKLNYFGNAWECQYGFYRSGNACAKVELPQNAKLNYFGNAWDCQQGFYRSGSACVKVDTVNASPYPYSVPYPTAPPTAGKPGCAENGSCYGDISTVNGMPKTIQVNGYFRKDGTYVRGHYRSRGR